MRLIMCVLAAIRFFFSFFSCSNKEFLNNINTSFVYCFDSLNHFFFSFPSHSTHARYIQKQRHVFYSFSHSVYFIIWIIFIQLSISTSHLFVQCLMIKKYNQLSNKDDTKPRKKIECEHATINTTTHVENERQKWVDENRKRDPQLAEDCQFK